jgi:SNF2 family DNA or RNA helicase
MDETWNPDDQEQAEDRCHRASRIHQVTCYYLRTKNTIEEYIYKINLMKSEVNWTVLDLKRIGDKL